MIIVALSMFLGIIIRLVLGDEIKKYAKINEVVRIEE